MKCKSLGLRLNSPDTHTLSQRVFETAQWTFNGERFFRPLPLEVIS